MVGEEFYAACATEHADGDQHSDQIGDDADGYLETFLGALDEFFVNGDFLEGGIEGEEGGEEGDSEDGGGADCADERAALAGVGVEREF
ncbi:MAG: hypothetical protein RI897_173 [Verrucomicrobiota bacterium]